MGKERTEASVPGDLVLDAGALIAFEREEEDMVAIIDQAANIEASILIPASALAQAWRGGGPRSARLARLIAGTESDALDEARAKEVGERLGVHSATDVADAHVVCCALAQPAALVTSDPDDMKALAEPGEGLTVVSV